MRLWRRSWGSTKWKHVKVSRSPVGQEPFAECVVHDIVVYVPGVLSLTLHVAFSKETMMKVLQSR